MTEHETSGPREQGSAGPGATYDPTTALVVVDVQNDFADPRGALYVPGGEELVPVVNREIDRALGAGALVVCTQDWHPERTPHFQTDGGIWPVHCVAGTWGARLHPGLRAIGGEPIRKGSGGEDGYSAFSVRDPTSGETAPTRLERVLREGASGGWSLSGSRPTTAWSRPRSTPGVLGSRTLVLAEAVRAVNLHAGDGDRALERMRAAGATII